MLHAGILESDVRPPAIPEQLIEIKLLQTNYFCTNPLILQQQ